MAIVDILEMGRLGLLANRAGLQTTSNNIANASTPGYTKQKPILQNYGQQVNGSVASGGGVYVAKVVREHNSFVQNQIIEESKGFGASKTRLDTLQRLEQIVHNNDYNMGELVNRFFNDMRELSANPETSTLRSAVAGTATSVAYGFRSMNGALNGLKRDVDEKLEYIVGDVNAMAKELGVLNERLANHSTIGDSPLELLDRRDQIVRDLAQKLGFQANPDDHEHVNLNVAGLGILVQGNEAHELVLRRTPEKGNKDGGSVEIFIKEPNLHLRNVTAAFKEGEVGGLLQVRDQIIEPAIKNLDAAAYEFATHVNEVHKTGVGMDGRGSRGIFGDLTEMKDASRIIDVHDEVKRNHEAIAAGLELDTPGDNRVALEIADIQNQKILPSDINLKEMSLPAASRDIQNSHTLNESLNELIGKVAVHGQRAEEMYNHQEALMTQLDNYRQSISGVSLEEEAINMMQFQAMYNASAKMIRVGDELFQTLLTLKQ